MTPWIRNFLKRVESASRKRKVSQLDLEKLPEEFRPRAVNEKLVSDLGLESKKSENWHQLAYRAIVGLARIDQMAGSKNQSDYFEILAFLARFHDYLRQNLQETLTATLKARTIAEGVRLSKTQFSKILVPLVNTCFVRYLVNKNVDNRPEWLTQAGENMKTLDLSQLMDELAGFFDKEMDKVTGISSVTVNLKGTQHKVTLHPDDTILKQYQYNLDLSNTLVNGLQELTGWSRPKCRRELKTLCEEASKRIDSWKGPESEMIKMALDRLKKYGAKPTEAASILHDCVSPFVPSFTLKAKYFDDHKGDLESEWREKQLAQICSFSGS